jgi:hypothetical protein
LFLSLIASPPGSACTGPTVADKLATLRADMATCKADVHVVSALDAIACTLLLLLFFFFLFFFFFFFFSSLCSVLSMECFIEIILICLIHCCRFHLPRDC